MSHRADRYLPDLAACFAGKATVFSWTAAFVALSSHKRDPNAASISTLISSSRARQLLSQVVPSFPPPTQQSQSQFDSRTSAVNAPPSGNNNYDVEEIKTNAKWLSKELNVAEDEALRLVMLEWQMQPAETFVQGYSDAELASLREALGTQDIGAAQGLSHVLRKRDDETFSNQNQVRRRVLNVYFKEALGLHSVSRRLLEMAVLKDDNRPGFGAIVQYAEDLEDAINIESGVSSILDAIEIRLQKLESGKEWSIDSDDVNDQWIGFELQNILVSEEILLLRVRNLTGLVDTQDLLRWLAITVNCDFFANIQPGPSLDPSHLESLQATASLILIAMLDPATTMSTLTESSSVNPTSYFLNEDAAHEVHKVLLSAAEACIPQATPAAFAWGLILGELKRQAGIAKEARETGAVQRVIDQVSVYDAATNRRTSTGSLQQSIYEEVVGSIMLTSEISDPAAYLIRCTIEAGNVFETINILTRRREHTSPLLETTCQQILQELLTIAVSSIGYTPEILTSQFEILTAGSSDGILPDPRQTFINNEFLMENIFAVAAGRFPYESLPFLRLCRILASTKIFDDHGAQYIAFRLRGLESFTQIAVGYFSSYRTVREDENLNLVSLDNSADMFEGLKQRSITNGQSSPESSIIVADTIGEVISESRPPIIRWQHSYSGLSLLGVWLELYYSDQLQPLLQPSESPQDVATEIIGLISALLHNTIHGLPSNFTDDDRKILQNEILDEVSLMLRPDSNVADYVFDILEQELHAYRRRPSNTFNTSVLVACIDFISVLAAVRPDQFWPSFSKSSILESYGSAGLLLSVIAGVEVPTQQYPLLKACAKLYDSVIRAVLRQSRFGTPRSRVEKPRNNLPQNRRLHANVLLSITQSIYNAFEAIPSWTFSSSQQEDDVVSSIALSFERIIRYANATQPSKSGLTSSFEPASDFLAQHTRLSSDDLSSTTSIVQHIFRAEELQQIGSNTPTDDAHDVFNALLGLSLTLVKLGTLRDEPPSTLDLQLFNAVPLICRRFTVSKNAHAIHLVECLLEVVAKSKPVSLLGHLGSVSSICLLETLKLNLGEWTDNSVKHSVWDLLSRLVVKNQQWLAIVILTGSPPDKIFKDAQQDTSHTLRGATFLQTALQQLTVIVDLDPQVAISMLRFAINAQMNWSWANETMKSDKDFLPAVMSYICNTYVDASDDIKISYRNKVAALVTDLTTIHLHHTKARRDTATLKTIIPLLRWLTGNAIDVSSYKHSLHANLRKNLSTKFGGLELDDFKRTSLFETQYGADYFYDLEFANEIFRADLQWNRQDKYRDQSFSAEFRRANMNLSVVDSEIVLLNSFLTLCVEHSGYFTQDLEVQKTVIDIVKHSLDANTQLVPSEKIFENVLQVRADMTLSLLQRLVDAKARGPEVRSLLKHAWECARYNNGSFEQAVIDGNLTYWRSMLTTVLLTLQFQVEKRYMPPAADSSPAALLRHTEQATPIILDIISIVIGQGFKSVATALQDQRQSSPPITDTNKAVSYKDIHIILTILETILRMARLPEFVSEASERLIAEGSIQSCLVLYSWSHMIMEPAFDNEPIYAGYCLRFLASLSSLPLVTEELAVEGILSRLLATRITQKLQSVPDGATHVDKRPHVQTLYNLWATGLLPICLNMLHSVGAPVAAEVSVFLNQFANQLNRASVAFVNSRTSSTNVITSTVADEAETLALISFILSSYRNAGASAAVDPYTIRILGGYDEHKKVLAEDISDVVNSTPTALKSRIAAVNEKELTLLREEKGEILVKKVVQNLRNALVCLKGEENDEEK